MAETDNLDDAVTDAVNKDNVPDKDKPLVKDPADDQQDDQDEVEDLEIDASAEEIRNAITIFRSLNDPAERGKLIESMAREGGYDLTKKTEVKKLERDAKAILKEKLGANYDVLNGDALSEALEELVGAQVERITKPVLDRVTASEKASNDEKASTAMNKFFSRNEIKDTKDRETIAAKMLGKMKVMPAAPGADIDIYLDDLYTLVSGDKGEAKGVKRAITRIRQNAKDSGRLSGEGTGNDGRIKSGSHMPDLDESVRAAYAGKKLE